MAIEWGSYSGGYRLGLEFERTGRYEDREIWVCRAYVQCYTQTYDYENTFSVSGYDGSGKLNISGGSTRYKVFEKSDYWLRHWGSERRISVTFSVTGVGSGYPPAVTGSFTVAARPYTTPADPTNVVAARISDSQIRLGFTAVSSSKAPVTHTIVRRQTDDGAWADMPDIRGTGERTWVDTGVSAGHYYRYRVGTVGPSGLSSSWVYSPVVYTTPSAPRDVTAVKDGRDVVLSWRHSSAGALSTQIFEGSTLVATAGVGAHSYVVKAPDASRSHTYTLTALAPNGLVSAGVVSNTVQLLRAPFAPSVLAPSGYVPVSSRVEVRWQHNSADGSEQTKAQIQYADNPVSPQWNDLGSVVGSSESYVWDVGASVQQYVWRVRTWGQDASKPSPWSSPSAFRAVERPRVTVSAPSRGSTVQTNETDVVFTVTSTVDHPTWTVQILADGAHSQTLTGVVDATPTSVHISGLRNGSTYTVRVLAADYVQSVSHDTSFTVIYAQPDPPTLTAEWDADNGATHLTIAHPATGIEVQHVNIERNTAGIWETIAQHLPPNSTYIDPIPPLDMQSRYRAVAVSTIATQSVSPTVEIHPVAQGVYINWGKNFNTCIRLLWNIESETSSRLVHRVEHVFAGQSAPTIIQGTAVAIETKISATLGTPQINPRVIEQVKALQEVSVSASSVALRRPDWGTLVGWIEASTPRNTSNQYSVSLTHHVAQQ